MEKLIPAVRYYDWGMPYHDSMTRYFLDKINPCQDIIAELWWGSHPQGLTITHSGMVIENIPFLLKLITVSSPLSLQLHPTKEQLLSHSFPDPHPKPEIVIALTEFSVLSGFLPPSIVVANLNRFHGLFDGVRTLQDVFALPTHRQQSLLQTIKEHPASHPLVLSLMSRYPDDPASLAPLFMNHIVLQEGQALVIPASEPHCYLYGEAVECMPPSDNIVRCGLTHKHCDIALFFQLCSSPRRPIVLEKGDGYTHPVLEDYFRMERVHYGERSVFCEKNSIVLVIGGEGILHDNIRTSKGGSWWVREEGVVRIHGVDAIIVQPSHLT